MKPASTLLAALLQPLNAGAMASLLRLGFARIDEAFLLVLALSPSQRLMFANPSIGHGGQGTAAAQVLAAELEGRQEAGEALSLMVSTIASMVQAGRSTSSRWNAG